MAAPAPAGPASRPIATTAPAPAGGAQRPDVAARRADIEARAAAIEGGDFFQVLGVAPESPPERIQSAYFALAKQWHPDRTPAELQDLRPLITRAFARVSEAYQTLNDPKRRAEYVAAQAQAGGATDEEERVARAVDAALEFQKAEILLKKRDLAGAEALARRAAEADPDQPEYKALLAWIQAQRRGDPPAIPAGGTSTHYDDLIEALDAVLAKEPEYERALFYRGMLLKRSGHADKAIQDFKLAATLNPKNLDAVREVRLHDMRKRSGGDEPPPEGGGGGGSRILGKLWKR
jgi:curved DNA-binding protein CbpA